MITSLSLLILAVSLFTETTKVDCSFFNVALLTKPLFKQSLVKEVAKSRSFGKN